MPHLINRFVSATTLAVLALSLMNAPAANAQNLLLNPGFESGTTDWTFDNFVTTETYASYGLTPTPEFGTILATFNSGGAVPTGVLSQTFATNPGTTYDASFFFGTFGVGAAQHVLVDAFDFSTSTILGGIDVLDNTGTETFTGLYTPYSFTFTATGTQTTLRFSDQPAGDQSSSDGLLDNVSVVAVPEASTFALILPALAMVGAVVIRRRKNA